MKGAERLQVLSARFQSRQPWASMLRFRLKGFGTDLPVSTCVAARQQQDGVINIITTFLKD